MKSYKFRGKRLDTGEIICGDLSVSSRPAIGNGKRWFLVDAKTIAQFVGFDYDGNEIYEGDELVQPTNVYNRFIVRFKVDAFDKFYDPDNFDYRVKAYTLVSANKLKERKATLWRGKSLSDGTSITGELQIRPNLYTSDRYDCFICDDKGLHVVDIVSLERVESQ